MKKRASRVISILILVLLISLVIPIVFARGVENVHSMTETFDAIIKFLTAGGGGISRLFNPELIGTILKIAIPLAAAWIFYFLFELVMVGAFNLPQGYSLRIGIPLAAIMFLALLLIPQTALSEFLRRFGVYIVFILLFAIVSAVIYAIRFVWTAVPNALVRGVLSIGILLLGIGAIWVMRGFF